MLMWMQIEEKKVNVNRFCVVCWFVCCGAMK
jgi:hypothetical protein